MLPAVVTPRLHPTATGSPITPIRSPPSYRRSEFSGLTSWGTPSVADSPLELYRRHPALPPSLVVAAAFAGWVGSLPTEEVRARLELALRQADELSTAITPDSVPGLFSTKLGAEQLEELAAIMSEVRPAGMRTMARAFAEADLRDVLASIELPTLLLYGDADQRASRAVWEPLRAEIPTSTLVLLPGSGHDLALEAPEAFNAEVRRFIRSFS